MNKKITIILICVVSVLIVVFAAIGIRNVIRNKEAQKSEVKVTISSGETKVIKPSESQGISSEASKVYNMVNNYREKMNLIVDNASHTDNKKIEASIKDLKDIQDDINENHKEIGNYDAGVDLLKDLENSIKALQSQIYLNDLEK